MAYQRWLLGSVEVQATCCGVAGRVALGGSHHSLLLLFRVGKRVLYPLVELIEPSGLHLLLAEVVDCRLILFVVEESRVEDVSQVV